MDTLSNRTAIDFVDLIAPPEIPKVSHKSIETIIEIIKSQDSENETPNLTPEDSQVLFTAGRGYLVAGAYHKFQGLEAMPTIQQLCDEGFGYSVVWNLSKFNLTATEQRQLYNQLVSSGRGELVAYQPHVFHLLDQHGLANDLVKQGYGQAVANNADRFTRLNSNDLALLLIDYGFGSAVMAQCAHGVNASYFDQDYIIQELLSRGEYSAIARNLFNMANLDNQIAYALIEHGYGFRVEENRNTFKNAETLPQIDYAKAVKWTDNLEAGSRLPKGIDPLLAVDQICCGSGNASWITENIEQFPEHLHPTIARMLIEYRHSEVVINALDRFRGIDKDAIAKMITVERFCFELYRHADKFPGLDRKVVAQQMIDSGDYLVKGSMEKIDEFSEPIIVEQLIETGHSANIASYLRNVHEVFGSDIPRLMGPDDTFADQIRSNLFRFRDIPSPVLSILRVKFNMPELTEYPRTWQDEDGKIKPVSDSVVDRWYESMGYSQLAGGFSKTAVGGLIRRQIESGSADNLHDATLWLNTFKIPDAAYDVETILAERSKPGFVSGQLEKTILSDKSLEILFVKQLLSTDPFVRKRLTFEGIQRVIPYTEKLARLFNTQPDLRIRFNKDLGIATAEVTDSYYAQLLAQRKDLLEELNQALSKGVTKKKYFADLLKKEPALAAELERHRLEKRESIEISFYDSAISQASDSPNLKEQVDETANNETWFVSPECRLLFWSATGQFQGAAFYKHDSFTLDSLFHRAEILIDDFVKEQSQTISKDETGQLPINASSLITALSELRAQISSDLDSHEVTGRVSETAGKLKEMRNARGKYVRDTQSWLLRHAGSPPDRLKKVWGDRPLALAQGTPDNAIALEVWHNINGLKNEADRLDGNGELQKVYGLSYEDVMGDSAKATRQELMRRLSVSDTLKAMGKLKKWRTFRHEKAIVSKLPAAIQEVTLRAGQEKRQYTLEILDKEDPRGFTIGEDTYCCMTINGESKDCIRAGYIKPNCGFIVVLDNGGDVVAQSFWYINEKHPDILVLDNIEANDGRDLSSVADIYRLALTDYFTIRPELGVKKVHLGTGYSDIGMEDMPVVEPVKPLKSVKYSDAKHQRLLLDLTVTG